MRHIKRWFSAGVFLLCGITLAVSGCARKMVFDQPELLGVHSDGIEISFQTVEKKHTGLKSPPPHKWENVLCVCKTVPKKTSPSGSVSILASGRPEMTGLVETGSYEATLEINPGRWIGRESLDPLDMGFSRRAYEFLDTGTQDCYLTCTDTSIAGVDIESSNRTMIQLKVIDPERLYKEIKPLYNRPLDIEVVEAVTGQPVGFAQITIKRLGRVGLSEHFRCCEAVEWGKSKLLGPKIREITTDESGRFLENPSGETTFLTTPAKHRVRVEAGGYHPVSKTLWFYKNTDPIRLRVELYRAASLEDPPPKGTITKIETE